MEDRSPVQFYAVLIGALGLLFTIAAQYPLDTTFPIGGDATRYILKLLEARDGGRQDGLLAAGTTLLTNTPYPGAQIILATSALLPISWPERFTWLMSLGHIAAGLTIGYFAWRLNGPIAAAASIAIWALTAVTILPHIESGTLAHLWSLPFLILFLERLMHRAWKGAALFGALTLVTHPISGAVAILTFLMSMPGWLSKKEITAHLTLRNVILSAAVLIIILASSRFVVQSIRSALTADIPAAASESMFNIIYSPFGPFWLIAPIGILVLIQKRSARELLPLLGFTALSLLLVFNDRVGAGFYPPRFLSYPIVAAALFAGIGLPQLIRSAIPHKVLQGAFALLLIAASTLYMWDNNTRVFAFYESGLKYARLHDDERAAIEWIREETSTGAFIVSTNANRHSEWIPILGKRQRRPLLGDDPLWNLTEEALTEYIQQHPYTHLVLFKHREAPKDLFSLTDPNYPILFENKGAVIIQLK